MTSSDEKCLKADLEFFRHLLDVCSVTSPSLNMLAVALQSISSGLQTTARSQRDFEALLALLVVDTYRGPFPYFVRHNLLFSSEKSRLCFAALALALARALVDSSELSPESASAFWRQFSSDPKVAKTILQFLCDSFALEPAPLWSEALGEVFLPTVPERIHTVDSAWWYETRNQFKSGKPTQADVYAAAWQLIFDGALYIIGYHTPEEEWLREELKYNDEQVANHLPAAAESQALFAELAKLTRGRDDAPLRIAHCIRDLSYGDKSRVDDLKAMVASDDPELHDIFVRSYWLPTPEEAKREAEQEARLKTERAAKKKKR